MVIVGNHSSFIYLLQRYADRIGCSLTVIIPSGTEPTIFSSEPVVVIFSSIETLEACQPLVAELTNRDVPILVCSSATDQLRARELGADYCLFHPLTYTDFQTALTHATASKHI
jgi:CheY-like chemotaxis protein